MIFGCVGRAICNQTQRYSTRRLFAAAGRQPGVFVPSPAQAWQQTVDVITRVSHAESAPDQAGDSFRGPDWGIKPVCYWPLLQQIGKACQFLTRQFGAASRLWPPPQSIVSSRAVPQSPTLDGLHAHSKRACDRGSGFTVLQPSNGGKPARLQLLGVAFFISQGSRQLPPPGRNAFSFTEFVHARKWVCPGGRKSPPGLHESRLEVETQFGRKGSRRDEVGSAECGEEIVKCDFIGDIDRCETQAPPEIVFGAEQVVVPQTDVK